MRLTAEQYAALRATFAAKGVELPLDLTDPRVTPEALKGYVEQLEGAYKEARGASVRDIKLLQDIRTMQTELVAQSEQIVAEAAELEALDAAKPADKPAAKPAEKVIEATGTEVTPAAGANADQGVTVTVAPEGTEKPGEVAAQPTTQVIGLGVTTDQAAVELAKVASGQAPELTVPQTGANGKPKASFVLASAQPGLGGQPIDISAIGPTMAEIGAQMVAATDSGVPFPKVQLASLPAVVNTPGVDKDGILMAEHGAAKNTKIIETVLAAHGERLAAAKAGRPEDKAITAAAPWCEPFETIRELPDCVRTDTPVRDSIPFVPMGYGGFQFNQAVGFAELAGAVDIWTPADQAAIDPTDPQTWKVCMTLECPDTLPTVTLDNWLTACLEWQIGLDLNNPERFRQYFRMLEAVRARLVDQYILSLLDALTINYTNSTHLELGGVPDLIAALVAAFQGSTYDERTVERAGYTMYIDAELVDSLMVSEIRASAAKTDATRAAVMAYVVSKVDQISRVIITRDRIPGSYGTNQANGNPSAAMPAPGGAFTAVPELITAGTIRLIPTAEVFAFGTGELRTGVRQDFSYARQNKVGWFAEEALALTRYGCQPWFRFNATINPQGFYVGLLNRQITAEANPFPTGYVANNANADVVDPNP